MDIETTGAGETAPSSSTEIASQVITDLESTGGGEETIEASGVDSVPSVERPAAEPTAQELSEAAKFLVAQGHKWGKRPDGKTDLAFLPASTVEKMLDRYVQQHRSTWDGERGTLEKDRNTYRDYVQELRSSVSGDPRTHLETLAAIDPRYAAFLQQQAQAKTDEDPEPQPDYPLGEGKFTYSLEGLQKREAWLRRQLDKMVDERLKPIAEREKAAHAREQEAEIAGRARGLMTEAQTWPMFGQIAADGTLTPFQQEVLTELQKDREAAEAQQRRPTMTVRQAYLEVHARHQEPDKMRERLIAELKTAPKAPALAPQGADTRSTKPQTSSDIARKVVADLERSSK